MSHFLIGLTSTLGLLATFGLSACSQTADQPERAFATFVTHVERGRADEAWAALSDESRRTLTERHEALARAAQRDPTGDVEDILFRELRLRASGDPDSIVVVGPLGERVRLRVSVAAGPSAEVWMVKEEDEWKVDLTRSLIRTSTRAEATGLGTARGRDGEGTARGRDGEGTARGRDGEGTARGRDGLGTARGRDGEGTARAGQATDAPTTLSAPVDRGMPKTSTPSASKP